MTERKITWFVATALDEIACMLSSSEKHTFLRRVMKSKNDGAALLLPAKKLKISHSSTFSIGRKKPASGGCSSTVTGTSAMSFPAGCTGAFLLFKESLERDLLVQVLTLCLQPQSV